MASATSKGQVRTIFERVKETASNPRVFQIGQWKSYCSYETKRG